MKKKNTPPYYELTQSTRVYNGLITQTGTDTPQVTELTNTLGLPLTWVRVSTGLYAANIGGEIFTEGRTTIMVSGWTNAVYKGIADSENTILISTANLSGTQIDTAMPVGQPVSVEIRVYP